MKITALKAGVTAPRPLSAVRGTQAQDAAVDPGIRQKKVRRRLVAGGVGVLALTSASVWLVHLGSEPSLVVPLERLQLATVTEGSFVRDVAAQGTVVAAVHPTLFAVAGGTVSYRVHAGDTVHQGEVLAQLDSPELTNEYQKERATLESLGFALARQELEVRRQIMTSRQQADLAQVSIQAAQREMKRAQWAWDLHAIAERDYRRSMDEVTTAKLNFEQAQSAANLTKDSLALELRTRRMEHERQELVVSGLRRRVDELTVRSPVEGMVADLAQADRARVTEGAALLTVVDLSAFEIEFQVAETYAREIRTGQAAEITLGGHVEPGVVTAISPEVRQSEVTGRVRFAHAQPAGLRQNQRAEVRIVLEERPHVRKLARGVGMDETTPSLYVVRGTRAVRVPVTLGAASITEIEVKNGLLPGDEVILSDTHDFKDAAQISLAR